MDITLGILTLKKNKLLGLSFTRLCHCSEMTLQDFVNGHMGSIKIAV